MTDVQRRAVHSFDEEFRVDVDRCRRIIAVVGEIDARSAPLVEQAAATLPPAIGGCTVLDFTAVTFCGADAMNLAVQLNEVAVRRGGRVVVRGASRTARRLFAACGLTGLIADD